MKIKITHWDSGFTKPELITSTVDAHGETIEQAVSLVIYEEGAWLGEFTFIPYHAITKIEEN